MAKKTAKKAATNKPKTKSEILRMLCEKTDLPRRDVVAVCDNLSASMKKELRGTGIFTVPGMIKVRVVKKAATKARKGINPFTGEEMMFKAKPARKVVKATPLKAVKDMV